MKEEMKQVKVRLPESLHKKLRIEAAEREISMQQIVEEIVKDRFERG
ncbi:hypothetical protein GCM10011571_32390 [Marinithermofilum abyssi]|uniref:Toxin-antitoxin system HicB family antitoxin n=1 Tax=Marinithermofilum abyssi TaxID=1571185 RepID=A0A8J2YBE4_9BACL|nr:hypothetical protein GCM10011571_32390 [Marinithermofilum abyssi]